MGIFELIYYIGYRIDTAIKLASQRELPARVISIGNITTGGTGKTPAAIALASEAKKRGLRPCVLTRGYKGKAKGPVIVREGLSSAEVGDEPLLMAARFNYKIPVVVGRNRYDSAMHALSALDSKPDLFILDDGFQHRALKRDMDIVLINSVDPFDNGHLLPVGLLREPLSQLKRASTIVLTKTDGVDTSELKLEIRRYSHAAPIFKATHVASGIKSSGGGILSLGALDGNKVYAFCGIGDPESFKELLISKYADIVGFTEFRDHHAYTQADIDQLASEAARAGASWIVTTEKDIMRLKDIRLPEGLYWVLMDFEVEAGFYDFVLGDNAINGGNS